MEKLINNTTELRDILSTVNSLPEAGGTATPVIEKLTVTGNGTYTASDGVDGYSPVVVDVSQSSSDVETCTLNISIDTSDEADDDISYIGTLTYSYVDQNDGTVHYNTVGGFEGSGKITSFEINNAVVNSPIYLYVAGSIYYETYSVTSIQNANIIYNDSYATKILVCTNHNSISHVVLKGSY